MFPIAFHLYPISVVEKCDLVTYIGGAYGGKLDLEFNFESKSFFLGENPKSWNFSCWANQEGPLQIK
jgi:hypothetical protein